MELLIIHTNYDKLNSEPPIIITQPKEEGNIWQSVSQCCEHIIKFCVLA